MESRFIFGFYAELFTLRFRGVTRIRRGGVLKRAELFERVSRRFFVLDC